MTFSRQLPIVTQPVDMVGVDLGHPLGSQVKMQWVPTFPWADTIGGNVTTLTAITNTVMSRAGDSSWVAVFNGSTSKVSFGDPSVVDFGTEFFSIELLVQLASVGSQQAILSKDNESTQRQLFCDIQGAGSFRFGWANNSGGFTLFDCTGAFPTGRLVHILCCRVGSTTAEVYLNGVKQTGSYVLQTASSVGATSAPLQLGQRANNALPIANGGGVALMRIYSGNINSWAAELSANPWSVCSPQIQRFWSPVAGGAYTLNAETGVYSFTGTDATLLHNYALTLESASYSLTGSNATLLKGLILDAASGSYTLTGSNASLVYNKLLNASSGSYSVTGSDANLIYTPASGAYVLNAESGAYVLTGSDVTFAYSGGTVTLKAGSWIRYRIIT